MNIQDPGFIGGMIGGVLGTIGGLLGTYAGIRAAKNRRDKWRVARYALALFSLTAAYVVVTLIWLDSVLISVVATIVFLAVLLPLSFRAPKVETKSHESTQDRAA